MSVFYNLQTAIALLILSLIYCGTFSTIKELPLLVHLYMSTTCPWGKLLSIKAWKSIKKYTLLLYTLLLTATKDLQIIWIYIIFYVDYCKNEITPERTVVNLVIYKFLWAALHTWQHLYAMWEARHISSNKFLLFFLSHLGVIQLKHRCRRF